MSTKLQLITKEELIAKFKEINAMGWVENYRRGNNGAVGNILEDLLGIPENNLPIPNAAEWELKSQRATTSSLITLCHVEPSPRAASLVPNMLLPLYGWQHKKAGTGGYSIDEKSFRSTTNAISFTDRGFKLNVNRTEQRIEFVFDSSKCSEQHDKWLKSVQERVGLGPFKVLPYWGFNDIYTKAGTKLLNCFYVLADVKKEGGKEYFHYNKVLMLKRVNMDKFINAIEDGYLYVDFDARTAHNHGTKFRIGFKDIPKVYEEVIQII